MSDLHTSSENSDDDDSEYKPSDMSEHKSSESSEPDETTDTEESTPLTQNTCENNKGDQVIDTFVLNVNTKSDKYSYCVFCDKRQIKLPRHCRRAHFKETLVTEAISVRKEDIKLKRQKWQKIRNLGNHEHNILVLQNKAKYMVVRKRPSDHSKGKHTIQDYVPCSTCVGYFHTNTLWKHKRVCPYRLKTKFTCSANHVKQGRSLIPSQFKISLQLRSALNDMKGDRVSIIVKNDRDILLVGSSVLGKSNSNRKADKAREKIRMLARILEVARGIHVNCKINQARDLIDPLCFDIAVKSALTVSGFNESDQSYNAYSTALRSGFALMDLAMILKNVCIRQQSWTDITKVDDFIHLMQTEWKILVSSVAQRQLQERAWKIPKILPLPD